MLCHQEAWACTTFSKDKDMSILKPIEHPGLLAGIGLLQSLWKGAKPD
jgi:hypothetical protein